MNLEDFKIDNKLVLGKKQRDTLEENGVYTVEQLAIASLKELVALGGFGEKTARKAITAARDKILTKSFMTAREYHEHVRGRVEHITTGSKQFDLLIGGGFATTDAAEVWAENAMGKTQLCMQLAVNVQLSKDKGGISGKCMYIDTEGNFSSERVIQMAKALNLPLPDTLEHIIYAEVLTWDHQKFILDEFYTELQKHDAIRLIIVDSLIGHLRSEFIGRESLSERQQLLNRYLGKLRKIARSHNIAIVYTNQAISNPTAFGMGVKAAGGNILGHGGTPNLWIRAKRKDGTRIVKLCKSPYLPNSECVFKITDKGIEDVEKE